MSRHREIGGGLQYSIASALPTHASMPPMTVRSPEEYRAEADRTREPAGRVDDTLLRTTMLEIADLYESMAKQVEKVAKQKTQNN